MGFTATEVLRDDTGQWRVLSTGRGGVALVGGGWGADLTIPPEVGLARAQLTVTSIGDAAFAGRRLRSATLPDTVVRVGACAFEDNDLESLAIPDSVVLVADFAFARNRLRDVHLGTAVWEVGAFAFAENNLTAVTLPGRVHRVLQGAFADNELAQVTFDGIGPCRVARDAFINQFRSGPGFGEITLRGEHGRTGTSGVVNRPAHFMDVDSGRRSRPPLNAEPPAPWPSAVEEVGGIGM